MSVTIKAFGTTVTETANRLVACGGGITDPRGRTRRLPMHILNIVERVAAGPTPLTADERAHLDLLDLPVVDATSDVRREKAYAMQLNGMSSADINFQLAQVPTHYRSEEPIGNITYFTPAR